MVQLTSSPARSWCLAFLDHINILVVILTASAILFTRSLGVAYCALGVIMCSLSVKLLKKAIRQPRPLHTLQQKVTYGMPSTHSAVTGYYTCYIFLSCFYLQLHRFVFLGPAWGMVFLVVVLPFTTSIVLSRVWLGHHTWRQVVVGTLYGIAFALGWFMVWFKGAPIQTGSSYQSQHFVS